MKELEVCRKGKREAIGVEGWMEGRKDKKQRKEAPSPSYSHCRRARVHSQIEILLGEQAAKSCPLWSLCVTRVKVSLWQRLRALLNPGFQLKRIVMDWSVSPANSYVEVLTPGTVFEIGLLGGN